MALPALTLPSVFIVDDDRGLVRLIEKELKREGFTVASATSAEEAVAWLGEHSADLMLLDLKLHHVEANEVIDKLKARGRLIPFIIITGRGDERVAVEMMKRGALDYLVKDARFQEFLPTVLQRALRDVDRDRKLSAAQEALKREGAFTTAVLDISGALMLVLDREARIVRFNRACEELSGYTRAEVRGKHVWDLLMLPEEIERLQNIYRRLFSGENSIKNENYWVTRSGERRLIAWSRTVLRNSAGELEYVIASGIDITDYRRLEQEVLRVSEVERRSIGQDLHDGLGQHLTGIELLVQALEQKLPQKHQPEAARISHHVREAIRQTRALARGLSPVELEANGLMSALQELADNIGNMFRISCRFHCPQPVLIADNAAATHLFRIAQEAVSNAVRHGQARAVVIALTAGNEVRLSVKDDGRGLPPENERGHGIGLRIMQYRAGMTGGTLSIQSVPGDGTAVVCSAPATLVAR
jgi:PAS domain S-box-containing protein